MLLYNPTKFLMIYGHNDFILDGKTQSEVRTLFDNALTKIQNFGITGADIMIGNCQTSSYFTTAPLQTLRDDYNAWLQTRQQEEGFILLDIYTITVDPGDPQSINPLYDDGDGVHFNALGMEAIAAGAYHHIESPVNLLDGKVVITDGSDTPIGRWNEW